jgi:hypothetical protein
MNPKVFLSYRRDDSAANARLIGDRLQRAFGRRPLFMDVDNVPLGVNFAKVVDDEIAKCEVLIAIIGRNWLRAQDDEGKRRLDNPNDFVRVEIATALRRNIRVIPILLDGTTVPKANELPEELKELALRNGLDVRHTSFNNDIKRLIRDLRAPHREENIKLVCMGCAAGLLVGVLPAVWASLMWTPESWWGDDFSWQRPPFSVHIGPLYQRAFEWVVFMSAGAAASLLRLRYSLLTTVAVSGILALLVFTIDQLFAPHGITSITPAFYGFSALVFYSMIAVLIYGPFMYGVFALSDRTSRFLKPLLVSTAILYSIVVPSFCLYIYTTWRIEHVSQIHRSPYIVQKAL